MADGDGVVLSRQYHAARTCRTPCPGSELGTELFMTSDLGGDQMITKRMHARRRALFRRRGLRGPSRGIR